MRGQGDYRRKTDEIIKVQMKHTKIDFCISKNLRSIKNDLRWNITILENENHVCVVNVAF